MARWFEFIGNHPFLFGVLIVLIVLFFLVENKRSGKKITSSELGLMVNNQNARLIDIRPANKFSEGYIQGSKNIPFNDFPQHINDLKQSTTPIILICEMGLQSGAAAALLGGNTIYRLDGGIAGWQAAGMPLVGSKK